MKAVGYIAWAFFTISAQAAYADVSCDVLGQGNKLYSSGNFEEAVLATSCIPDANRLNSTRAS